MKLLIWGIGGRLGQTLLKDASNKSYITEIAGFDKFVKDDSINGVKVYKDVKDIKTKYDVIIDFSKPDAIKDFLPYAQKTSTPVVIATTGHDAKQMKTIKDTSKKIPIFKTTNMSFGVNLLIELVKKAAKNLPDFDIEIVEAHHNIKVDAPSGTANTIAEEINSVFDKKKDLVYGRKETNKRRTKNEIGMHSLRGGSVVGKHSVIFLGNDEFLTLTHEAQSKSIFTEGALKAANFLIKQKNGMFDMKDLM